MGRWGREPWREGGSEGGRQPAQPTYVSILLSPTSCLHLHPPRLHVSPPASLGRLTLLLLLRSRPVAGRRAYQGGRGLLLLLLTATSYSSLYLQLDRRSSKDRELLTHSRFHLVA